MIDCIRCLDHAGHLPAFGEDHVSTAGFPRRRRFVGASDGERDRIALIAVTELHDYIYSPTHARAERDARHPSQPSCEQIRLEAVDISETVVQFGNSRAVSFYESGPVFVILAQ